MLIILTRSMKNGHTPLPWVVGYCILGSLVLKSWQFPHLETSSYTCWSLATAGCSHHCWVQRTLITSSIRTPNPRRGWVSREVSRIPWCSLSPVSSTTFTGVLNMSTTTLVSISMNAISSSHLPIRCSLIQALHPVVNIIGAAED